jgi:hypothetical protein
VEFCELSTQPNPEQCAWSVRSWCRALDLSHAFAYELLAEKKIRGIKVGGKRLIVTTPSEFIAAHADDEAA